MSMKKITALCLMALLVNGCASDNQIAVLRDPEVGHLIRCVPDKKNMFRHIGIGETVKDCVAFYRARGYVPVRKEEMPDYRF